VVEHRAGPLDPVFVALSVIGYAGLAWVALAPLLAIAARKPILATTALTALSVWTADLIATGLKAAVDRPRPFEVVPEADRLMGATVGTSFPSGHAATSAAGAVALALLVRRFIPALALLAAAIAFSRIYVGVHYPLDVVAGAALGAAVALAVWTLVRALRMPAEARRRSARVRPPG
jgi:undecaprenyl-diphosphatase